MSTVRNFIKTIRNSDQALNLFKDGGEVAIDAALENKLGIDGILKDIPILSIAVSLYKMGNKVSGYFFAKNMLAFLTEIDKVPNQKRTEFLDKNCVDEAGIESVGEVALMILDKLDHPKLATMLGRAFALLALGAISIKEFEIYAHVVKGMNPYLQQQLYRLYKADGQTSIDMGAALILANYGLVTMKYEVHTEESESSISQWMAVNDLGKKFYTEILLGSNSY